MGKKPKVFEMGHRDNTAHMEVLSQVTGVPLEAIRAGHERQRQDAQKRLEERQSTLKTDDLTCNRLK